MKSKSCTLLDILKLLDGDTENQENSTLKVTRLSESRWHSSWDAQVTSNTARCIKMLPGSQMRSLVSHRGLACMHEWPFLRFDAHKFRGSWIMSGFLHRAFQEALFAIEINSLESVRPTSTSELSLLLHKVSSQRKTISISLVVWKLLKLLVIPCLMS